MRKLLYILILILPISLSAAEKKKKDKKENPAKVSALIKTAKTAIKNGRNQQKAEENLVAALSRQDVTSREKAEIYNTCVDLQHSLNDAQNLKAYLKQAYDTTAFFSTILQMHKYALQCDSMESIPVEGKVKYKFRGKNRNMMQDRRYRLNLYQGGNFMALKQKWSEAWEYFHMYRTVVDRPIMQYATQVKGDTMLLKASYMATVSAFNAEQYERALEFMPEIINVVDSTREVALYEYMVRSYKALNQEENWIAALKEGVSCHPEHDYFYTHLLDYYTDKSQYAEGHMLSAHMLKVMGERALYYQGESKLLLAQDELDSCIVACDKAIALDSLCSEAYYNKGISYLNKAVKFAETASTDPRKAQTRRDRNRIKELYSLAQGPMEEYRRQQPELSDRWGNPLYRIYLNLNLGKKFAEIDNIINAKKE